MRNATGFCDAFESIRVDAGSPGFFDGATDEDVHTFVIRKLGERVGALADKIHTGRSRNEQVSLDTRLWLRDECDRSRELLRALMAALLDLAAKYPDAVIPGYTHLRRAQPVLWPHYLLAYFEMFARDLERLGEARRRANVMPLGLGRAGRVAASRMTAKPSPAISAFDCHHAQQHGRFGRPRFRARLSLCRVGRR